MQDIQDIKAVLLVGGMGTRLRSVMPATAKPLASVGDRPFLELLVRQLRRQGIRRMVMCTGYLAEQVESRFGDGRELDVEIEYSKETHPLGTGGAVKLAGRYLRNTPHFLVMNGDSFLDIDFGRLVRFHHERDALVSMAVLPVQNANRYGTVQADSGGRVIRFMEKTGQEAPGLVNAGVYVFSRAVLDHIPEGSSSLERDLFPSLLADRVFAQEQQGMFIDIGTPEDYARAQAICDRLHHAALGRA